jgi:hypothetical protein
MYDVLVVGGTGVCCFCFFYSDFLFIFTLTLFHKALLSTTNQATTPNRQTALSITCPSD